MKNNKQKIGIIFPPFSEHSIFGPALGVHLIKNELNSQAIHSEIFDFNIKLVRYLLSDKIVRKFETQTQNKSIKKANIDLLRIKNLLKNQHDIKNQLYLPQILSIYAKHWFTTPSYFSDLLNTPIIRQDFIIELYKKWIDDLQTFPVLFFSCAFSIQLPEILILSRLLKEKNSSLKIVIGGSQINLFSPEMLQDLVKLNLFDIIYTGFIEGNSKELLNELNKPNNTTRILVSKKPEKANIKNIKPNFDSLNEYYKPLTIPVLVSYGCYWGQCVFCDYSRLTHKKNSLTRNIQSIYNDILWILKTYNPEYIRLNTDAMPPLLYAKLAKMAIADNIALRSKSFMIHSDKLDLQFFTLLKQAGVKSISFGTESTIPRIFKLMNKPYIRETVIQNILDSSSAGIAINVNIIPDFPSITNDEIQQLQNDLVELTQHIDSLNISFFDLTWGSLMAKQANQFEIEILSDNQKHSHHGFHSLAFSRTGALNSEIELKKIQEQFKLIGSKAQLFRKKRLFKEMKFSETNTFELNKSNFIFVEKEQNYIWIENIRSVMLISQIEKNMLEQILNSFKNKISLKLFRDLYFEYYPQSKQNQFLIYFYKILINGIIDPIKSE